MINMTMTITKRIALPRTLISLWFVLLLSLSSAPAFAHHSFASFDNTEEVQIAGTVTEVQYMNPHVWVFVDLVAADGTKESWGIETVGPNLLIRAGWMKNTVQAGQKVTVVLHPLRDTSKRGGSLVSITLPDGKTIRG